MRRIHIFYVTLSAVALDVRGDKRLREVGRAMVVANKKSLKTSAKFNSEMFADVAVLQRKWQAAVRSGEKLPHYEDVMLGSLGRLADHIVLPREVDGVREGGVSFMLARQARQ